MPLLLLGDLNAASTQLPALQHALDVGSLHDLGSMGGAWGGQDCAPTAKAHNSSIARRIDYCFVCSKCLPMVRQWITFPWDLFDVHRPIGFELSVSRPANTLTW
eukprot:104502-Alexandrium_andersonii.AAC.1